MKKFFREFKEFISQGNILDMAVGVVIGAAFRAIVTSLVSDIIMPVISLVVGADITEWVAVLRPGVDTNADGVYDRALGETAPILLRYGVFIQTIIDFILIAFVIFIIIKVAMAAKKRREALKAKIAAKKRSGEELSAEEAQQAEVAPAISEEVLLLQEIRDLLKKDK